MSEESTEETGIFMDVGRVQPIPPPVRAVVELSPVVGTDQMTVLVRVESVVESSLPAQEYDDVVARAVSDVELFNLVGELAKQGFEDFKHQAQRQGYHAWVVRPDVQGMFASLLTRRDELVAALDVG